MADIIKSGSGDKIVHLNFSNNCPFPLSVYWIDYNGNKTFYKTLPPGGSYEQQTYATHPWLFIGNKYNEEIPLGVYFPRNDTPDDTVISITETSIGTAPSLWRY